MKLLGEITYLFMATTMFGQPVHGMDPYFHVPYACSIMYDYGIRGKEPVLIGAGSLLDKDIVLVSIDNLNNLISPASLDFFYQHVEYIYVHAGSNYMDPRRLTKLPKNVQTKQAKILYVPYKPSFNDPSKLFWTNPTNLSENGEIEYDAFGVAFNVGFLRTQHFSYSPFVLPILVAGDTLTELKQLTKKGIEFQEKLNMSTERCFTYSYNEKLNKMRYHEVTYLPKNNCIDVYCMYRSSKCTLFPKYEHLFCYKSTKYIDVCPEARGAALYCDLFHKSVLGILTFAPLCGQRNTPGVYTTLPLVVELYEKVFNVSYHPPKTKYTLDEIAKLQRQ